MIQASLSDIVSGAIRVSARQWVYVVCNESGEIMYVGKTIKNPKQRLSEHIAEKSPIGQAIRDAMPESLTQWAYYLFSVHDCRMLQNKHEMQSAPVSDLDSAEAFMIQALAPSLNVLRPTNGKKVTPIRIDLLSARPRATIKALAPISFNCHPKVMQVHEWMANEAMCRWGVRLDFSKSLPLLAVVGKAAIEEDWVTAEAGLESAARQIAGLY